MAWSVQRRDPQATPQLGAGGFLALAAWCGLLAGLLEVLTKVVCTAAGRTGRYYQMSRHFFWLIPVTNLLVFLGLGILLAGLVWMFPRFGRWFSLRSLAAMVVLPSFLVAVPEIHPLVWLLFASGLAVQSVRFLERRASGFRRGVAVSFPILIGLVIALAGFVFGQDWLKERRESARALPAAGSLNVVLITLDTVRADHLSLYGYGRTTTNTLEQLATRGVRFDRARSTSPWTLPSHASIFTGRLPHELKVDWLAPIGAPFPTLAKYLGEHGYSTCGFVANTLYCGYDTGLSAGFTHYEDYTLPQMDAFLMAQLTQRPLLGFFQLHAWVNGRLNSGSLDSLAGFVSTYVFSGKRKDAETVNTDFLNWLSRRRQTDRPFFAFLNYFDAHAAYFPPRPSDYRIGLRPSTPADYMALSNWETIDKPSLPEHFKALALDCYDDCIMYMDEQLNLLISSLGQQGILDNTVLIVASDHGEGFGEHDLYLHGDSLYRQEIHVPLLIAMPPSKPAVGRVAEPVSLRDLPATIVDLLGLGSGSPFPGQSLAGRWDRSKPVSSAPVVSELQSSNPTKPNQGRSPARNGGLTALAIDHYTYIEGSGTEELFDERTDPHERHNLAGDDSTKAELARFRDEIKRLKSTNNSR